MRLVTYRTRFLGLAALAVMAFVLPVAGSGCGRTSCFVYTKGEYDTHGGTCPAQAKALPNFSDSTCPGAVVSVDGPGIFTLNAESPDESLCCYPVTQRDVEPDFLDGECAPQGGAGGTRGVGGGFEGSTVGVGVGGAGGFTMGCVTCSDLLNGANGQGAPSCSSQTDVAWQTLVSCACATGATCAKVCALNMCKQAAISEECRACIEDTASGCGPNIVDCQSS